MNIGKVMNLKKIFTTVFLLAFTLNAFAQLNESLGKLSNYSKDAYGLTGTTPSGKFRVQTYGKGTIRVTVTKNETFDDFSYAVVAEPKDVGYEFSENEQQLLFTTDQIELRISKDPVRFAFYTKDGKVINEDEPAFGTSWLGEELTTYKKMQEGERFIGLGEKTGNLDRRGSGYTNWNTDYYGYPTNGDPIYASVPFYIGAHSGLVYGIFLDNSYKSHFNFGASNDRFSSFTAEAGDMDYYFFYEEDVAKLVDSYTELTGKMPMPPIWSMGFQQSRYSYFPDTEVETVAETFRRKQIPADVIVLDIHYMDDYRIFTWDPERFPEPKKLIGKLKDLGFHTMLMCDPGIKREEGYRWYDEGNERDLFVKYPDGKNYAGEVWPGWSVFPDFTMPEAREWFGQAYKEYVDLGVDAFWNDMNEIATWGQRLPNLIEFDFDGNPSTARRGRNVYGMQMARSTFEGTKELLDGRRPFVLTRAGFAGVQRYAAMWTGDNNPTDDHMLLGVRLVNSLGVSGVGYTGYDIGGFTGNPTQDLYARWMTIASFSPFFRSHTGFNSVDSEPWALGEQVEEISKNYIQLRYKLLPYMYSTFYEATQNGMPVTRTLAIDYTHDSKVYDHTYQNQYFFGQSMLICPVRSTESHSQVYLPEGEWFDLHTGQKHQGKQEIVAASPVAKLPVYIKGGAIIPMQSLVQNTQEKPEGTLYVHVYKGSEDNHFIYYEDDGVSYEFEDGKFFKRTIYFLADDEELVFGEVEGDFKSKFDQVKVFLHGFGRLEKVKINKGRVSLKEEQFSYFKGVAGYKAGQEGAVAEDAKGGGQAVKTFTFDNTKDKVTVSL
jgi:alpha-glucosidase